MEKKKEDGTLELRVNYLKRGRKFFVVIMAGVLLALGMLAGMIGAERGLSMPWLAVTLPILAGVLPVYIGGNAYQKGKELSK